MQAKLEELLGSREVYYQTPDNRRMVYPAIVYSRKDIESRYADNAAYSLSYSYEIIAIDRKPDNPVVEKLLQLPYSSYDRSYKSDNLHHEVLTLYY